MIVISRVKGTLGLEPRNLQRLIVAGHGRAYMLGNVYVCNLERQYHHLDKPYIACPNF